MSEEAALPWWQGRRYALLLILMAGMPLWWPGIPPLVDLIGHMGRYRIQLGIDSSPFFQQYFDFDWALLANLGVDLLVEILGPLLGLELAVRLIVIAIPMITVAGMLLIVREVHGRLPATVAFAVPLSLGYPLHFGFVNFALSMGLALLAFSLWLRMERLGQTRLRTALFVPIGIGIWIVHIYGWGLLGLLVAAHEWRRAGWRGIGKTALRCLPLLPPLALMILWRGNDATGETSDWFNLMSKLKQLTAALRDQFIWFDIGCVIVIVLLIRAAAGRDHLRMEYRLGLATLFLLIGYIMIPRILLGSAYADMRLAPYLLVVGVLSISTAHLSRHTQAMIALAAAAFLLTRTVLTTAHFIKLDRQYDQQLAALNHLPRNSRVFSLVNLPCTTQWASSRMDHLSSMAIVRRDSFVNDQWQMPGAQLLRVRHPAAGQWMADPTQIVRPARCRRHTDTLYEQALAEFPRQAYDYLWLIDFPPSRWPKDDKGLTLVWRGEKTGALYRIGSTMQASETPSGKDARFSQ